MYTPLGSVLSITTKLIKHLDSVIKFTAHGRYVKIIFMALAHQARRANFQISQSKNCPQKLSVISRAQFKWPRRSTGSAIAGRTCCSSCLRIILSPTFPMMKKNTKPPRMRPATRRLYSRSIGMTHNAVTCHKNWARLRPLPMWCKRLLKMSHCLCDLRI